MRLYKTIQAALNGAGAISSLAKRHLVEIHSSKAIDSRFAVVSDVSIIRISDPEGSRGHIFVK